jgi:hypothetical protein
MNKKIEALIEEADRYSVVFSTLEKGRKEIFREKLSELLVAECANVIQDFVDHRFPASEYPQRLRNYFK